MPKFNLRDFLSEDDGPEFIFCSICKYNRKNADCIEYNSMLNSESPSEEVYFNICKKFSPQPYPISPDQFSQLMKACKQLVKEEPSCGGFVDGRDELRYMMEYVMLTTLESLGYKEGVAIFKKEAFELPF